MNAKLHDTTVDDTYVNVAPGPVADAGAGPGPRGSVRHGWVSESVGFDSKLPETPGTSGAYTEPFQYEKVSVAQAREEPRGSGNRAVPEVAPRTRPRSPLEPLQEATLRWIGELPEKVRPVELARLFPRVANKLCGLWIDPLLSDAYLTSLLMDSRDGGREGFPMAVAAELAALFSNADGSTREHSQPPPKGGGWQAPAI